MRVIYVAGAHPGAGSTAVAAGLVLALRGAGVRAVALKPAPHREDDADAAFLTRLNCSESEADASVVVLDGLPLAGGNGASAALAERLDAAVVGVVPFSDAAEHPEQWRIAFGERLTGVVVNRLSRYGGHSARTVLASAFEEASAPPLAVLPEDRLLLAPSVVQVGEHLGATFFCKPEVSERLIEHFVIGGLIAEWGGNYFGRLTNQAVLVRRWHASSSVTQHNRSSTSTSARSPRTYRCSPLTSLRWPSRRRWSTSTNW